MERYSTVSRNYINNIKKISATGWICVILTILAMSHINNQKTKQIDDLRAELNKRSDPAYISSRMNQILEEARLSKVRMVIKTGNKNLPWSEVDRIAKNEVYHARKAGIDIPTGLAIAEQETHFDPSKVSYTGCCFGWKQINYGAHKEEYNIKNPSALFDPVYNIKISYMMLGKYKKQYGSTERALKRYYGSTVDRDNALYAMEVMEKAKRIRKRFDF